LRRAQINVYQIENRVIVEKEDERNIPMIINSLTKRKTQQREADIDVSDDPRRAVGIS